MKHHSIYQFLQIAYIFHHFHVLVFGSIALEFFLFHIFEPGLCDDEVVLMLVDGLLELRDFFQGGFIFFLRKIWHVLLVFLLSLAHLNHVLGHHTQFIRVSFLLLHEDLFVKVKNFILMHLFLLDFLDYFLHALHRRFQVLEYLIGEHLILRVLWILLKFILWLLQLRVHHLYLSFQLRHFLDLLSLNILYTDWLFWNLIFYLRD